MAKEVPALLIVDGYNVLNAWRGKLKNTPLADARDDLIHALADYAGYTGQKIVLVFDAWKSERIARTVEQVPATLEVVFTRKGETADHYIERLCDEVSEKAAYGKLIVRVATSDSIEQTIAMGRGAIRISARELLHEIDTMRNPDVQRRVLPVKAVRGGGSTVMDRLPEEMRAKLEKMRRGEE
ncbi:MAG: NYN domain-containing protein [Clostridia bacterium]|nr:NYN domain-containing protein [Clostridia bacterium]